VAQKTFGFGIAGTGMIASFHAKAIQAMADGELLAIHGRNAGRVAELASQFGCTGYTDYDAFLAHDGLDIVNVCTASGAHLDPAAAAARAGKHVVCEKPLEVTTERIDAMIAACAENGVVLAGIFPRRYNPATTLLKQAVDTGRFGRIVMADAYVKWWRTQAYYDSGAWRGTWALDGGGAMMNQAIHTIDLLLYVMGNPKTVRAETRLVAHSGIEVEDAAFAMVEFESGAMGVIQASTACWSENGHPAEVQICGTEGSVFMTDDRFRIWEFLNKTPQDLEIVSQYGMKTAAAGAGAADPAAIDFSWHQRNLEDVVDALQNGRRPLVDGAEGRRAVALIRAIYASSAAGGEKVEVM
jgi:UDP-N-acetyl-2-amino-2-deoxyglucuronate dehydrogenase